MGVVYEAIQLKLERRVALKTLTAKLTKDRSFLTRFQREAKAAAALDHPNIIQVYDIGQDRGVHFFAMTFVDGESVMERVKREGKLPPAVALDIVGQVAKALRHAKQKSIIHRDIKPDNIMLTRHGDVRLADLGLAKRTGEESSLTQTGVGMGTPYYMAPEQFQAPRSVDHRADIYALGITLLYLLTGDWPFKPDPNHPTPVLAVMFAHVNEPLPSGADLGTPLPAEVETVIQKMCAKAPGDRYQDYESLLVDLEKTHAEATPCPDAAPLVDRSASTRVETRQLGTRALPLATGKRRKWFPLWVGLGLAVGAIAGIVILLGRDAGSRSSRRSAHRVNAARDGDAPAPLARPGTTLSTKGEVDRDHATTTTRAGPAKPTSREPDGRAPTLSHAGGLPRNIVAFDPVYYLEIELPREVTVRTAQLARIPQAEVRGDAVVWRGDAEWHGRTSFLKDAGLVYGLRGSRLYTAVSADLPNKLVGLNSDIYWIDDSLGIEDTILFNHALKELKQLETKGIVTGATKFTYPEFARSCSTMIHNVLGRPVTLAFGMICIMGHENRGERALGGQCMTWWDPSGEGSRFRGTAKAELHLQYDEVDITSVVLSGHCDNRNHIAVTLDGRDALVQRNHGYPATYLPNIRPRHVALQASRAWSLVIPRFSIVGLGGTMGFEGAVVGKRYGKGASQPE